MSKLSIIIPVYNEKETILKLLDKVDGVDFGNTEKEVIIIDDCSTDGTKAILQSIQYKYKVIFHEKNFGKGLAIRTGLKRASGDWVVIQDADLEYDPEDLKLLLNKIQTIGVLAVYGSRRLRKKLNKQHSGFFFAVGGIFLTFLTNLLYQTKITDEATCYKMFRTDLLKSINLQCQRFEFCPEVTAKIAKRKIKIYEVPVSYHPRHKSEGKKINFQDGLEAIWTLVKYKFVS